MNSRTEPSLKIAGTPPANFVDFACRGCISSTALCSTGRNDQGFDWDWRGAFRLSANLVPGAGPDLNPAANRAISSK